MRHYPTLLLALSLACNACRGIDAGSGTAATGSSGRIFHDGRIEMELAGKGGRLLGAGKAAPVSNLVAQLSRKSCALNLPPCLTTALSPEELCAKTRESVIVIAGLFKCKKCTEWHATTATAFAIAEPDIFLTNYHVIEDEKAALIAVQSYRGTVSAVAEVLAADRSSDFAVVRIPGLNLKPIPLRPSAPDGTPIALVSHPNRRFFSFARGDVSRYYRTARRSQSTPIEWLQVTVEFAKGSSGGPVIDLCGNAIGMVASTQAVYYDEDDALSAQMVFHDCVPMRTVLRAVQPASR